jgi:transcriptional regulator with XRE-family HTH domain
MNSIARVASARKPGRKRLPLNMAKEIRERLRTWYRPRYKTQEAFAERLNLPRTTVTGWFHTRRPKSPDLVHLLGIASREGLSLNWLLLGEPPEMRGAARSISELAADVRRYLVAGLQRGASATGKQTDEYLPGGEDLLERLVVLWVEPFSRWKTERLKRWMNKSGLYENLEVRGYITPPDERYTDAEIGAALKGVRLDEMTVKLRKGETLAASKLDRFLAKREDSRS